MAPPQLFPAHHYPFSFPSRLVMSSRSSSVVLLPPGLGAIPAEGVTVEPEGTGSVLARPWVVLEVTNVANGRRQSRVQPRVFNYVHRLARG